MFAHAFVRNAYLAGTFIALACGVVGWFAVLRAQVFAADALSHVAFVGAIAAVLAGVSVQLGLVVVTLAVAAGMAGLGRRGHADDVAIGITFAWILGVGVLLIRLLATSAHGGQGLTAVNALFGSIYALSAGLAVSAALISLAVLLAVALAFRPLLFATLDPELAGLRGVRVRALGAGFLAVLALLVAAGTQAMGALLLLGLIAAPAGAAHQLTGRSHLGAALSALIAVGAVWAGLALSYTIAGLPPSSAIVGLAAVAYAVAAGAGRIRSPSASVGSGVEETGVLAERE